MSIRSLLPTIVTLAVALFLTVQAVRGQAPAGPIDDGPELDYQPSIIRTQPSGDLMLVFERLDPGTFFGDLGVSFSSDNGLTWSPTRPIIATPLNERHPALLQQPDGSFVLFYLVDETGAGSYRIHRATSTDGTAWTGHGALDLGWATAGEINPAVILEEDGSLTMTYHRLGGPSYIARSLDGGVVWDTLKTQVSDGQGALPRLAKRESDGLYLVTYQVGGGDLDMYAKVSTDPYDWSDPPSDFSTLINSHDSQPIVLEGGYFLVTFARQNGSVFDLYYKAGHDGREWSDATQVTSDLSYYDTQPHPLLHGTPGHVILSWSHQKSPVPYVDHDVWVDADLEIPLPLWLDADTLSATDGGTIVFSLDAGPAFAGRRYFLVASKSGTSPGTTLPGGGLLPLNRDGVTNHILNNYNNARFVDFRGTLDADGRATAVLHIPDGVPFPPGTVLHFAFTTEAPYDFQSNPVAVRITP